MTTNDAVLIQRRALEMGGDRARVGFLKSKAVAQEVANRAWAVITTNYAMVAKWGRDKVVVVKPSQRFPGTWKVEVRPTGKTLSSRLPRAQGDNRRHAELAAAILRQSYSPADLVTVVPKVGRNEVSE